MIVSDAANNTCVCRLPLPGFDKYLLQMLWTLEQYIMYMIASVVSNCVKRRVRNVLK